MFEPLRVGLFTLGILLLIGAMLYAAQELSLPGGFSDIATSLTYLYFIIMVAFVFGLFFMCLNLLITAVKGKKHSIDMTGNKRL